jgi:hypothetical protein
MLFAAPIPFASSQPCVDLLCALCGEKMPLRFRFTRNFSAIAAAIRILAAAADCSHVLAVVSPLRRRSSCLPLIFCALVHTKFASRRRSPVFVPANAAAIFSVPPTSAIDIHSASLPLAPSFTHTSSLVTFFHSVLSTLYSALLFKSLPPSRLSRPHPSGHRGISPPRSPSPVPDHRTSHPTSARTCSPMLDAAAYVCA